MSIHERSILTEIFFSEWRRCIPDGGDVGYTMTELQPSPPGYRVQDEAPGPPSCPPASYKYASHGHGSEAANFKSTSSYPQEGYGGLKQSPSRTVPPNEYYRRRNDGRRSTENEHEAGNATKKATIPGYNESHKKNTTSYKNDSGYPTFYPPLIKLYSQSLSLSSTFRYRPSNFIVNLFSNFSIFEFYNFKNSFSNFSIPASLGWEESKSFQISLLSSRVSRNERFHGSLAHTLLSSSFLRARDKRYRLAAN